MLLDILTLLSLLLMMLQLRRLVSIFPSMMACLVRGKESFNLEASVKLSIQRDSIALSLIIPFCLIATRFHLYDLSILDNMSEDMRLLSVIGIFLTYILVRYLVYILMRPQRIPKKTYRTAGKAAHTFLIILTLALLATDGISSIINMEDAVIKSAMLWISAIIYLVFLIRKIEIFASSCSIFTAFLYLCALEIIPTGTLLVPAIIFS